MTKRLWIDPEIVLDAIASKETLDALALCCMVKLTFADSMVKEASVRRIMRLFHISYGRCVKALQAGISKGSFLRDGDMLRANKVRGTKCCCVPLDIPVSDKKGECPIGIARMCDQLRGAVLYNHIAKLNDLRDTMKLARDPQPGEFRSMKRAMARLRKKGVCVNSSSAREVVRLSYTKVAELLGVSRTKAKTAIKRLRDKGLVRRVLQYEGTGIHIDQFLKQMQKDYPKHGGRGFMVLRDGMVCLQLANVYLLCGDSLVKFFS